MQDEARDICSFVKGMISLFSEGAESILGPKKIKDPILWVVQKDELNSALEK